MDKKKRKQDPQPSVDPRPNDEPLGSTGESTGEMTQESAETVSLLPVGEAPGTETVATAGLEDLDDVLVLLPEEDEIDFDSILVAPSATEAETDIDDITEEVTDVFLIEEDAASSERAIPVRAEEVGLLSQHPDHEILPSVGAFSVGDLDDLPDIEDVEDITSLVEEADLDELAFSETDDEELQESAPEAPFGSLSVLLKIAAALVVACGALYLVPGLGEAPAPVVASSELTVTESLEAPMGLVAAPESLPAGGGAIAAGVEFPPALPAEFDLWIQDVVATNFGVDAPGASN